MADAINPKHYQGVLVIPKDRIPDVLQEDGSISLQYVEMMEFMMTEEEFQGHLKGQGWKYLLRLGEKDEEVQELGKSIWYIDYLRSFFKRKKK